MTAPEISDSRKAFFKAFDKVYDKDLTDAALDNALEAAFDAVAPMLVRQGMEKVAGMVADFGDFPRKRRWVNRSEVIEAIRTAAKGV